MNRKQSRQQQARERRADKAWKEREQLVEEVFADLKAGEMTPDEFNQLRDKVKREIIDVLNYHKVPVGLFRDIFISLIAQSLAQQATNQDWLAETAAVLGRAMVHYALETYSMLEQH
jgi:hypothetical protein